MALPLPLDCEERVSGASIQPNLTDPKKIRPEFMDATLDGLPIGCDGFLTKCETPYFKDILGPPRKAFFI